MTDKEFYRSLGLCGEPTGKDDNVCTRLRGHDSSGRGLIIGRHISDPVMHYDAGFVAGGPPRTNWKKVAMMFRRRWLDAERALKEKGQ